MYYRCVRRYEGHANRFYPVGMRISPCSRFIGTGSEDKAVSRGRLVSNVSCRV